MNESLQFSIEFFNMIFIFQSFLDTYKFIDIRIHIYRFMFLFHRLFACLTLLFIRLMDMCGHLEIDIEKHVELKLRYIE